MSYRIPAWIRALLAFDRVACRLSSAREGARDELLLAFVPVEERAALTGALYARQQTYLPGGHRFESGLFSWEKRLLEHASFPKKGRILLGACGAGREMKALLERGFAVTAFDPCEAFVEKARALAREFPGEERSEVLWGAYEDLVAAAEGREGRLSSLSRRGGFDGVVLGWGSLSHVLPRKARKELFCALGKIAGRAPVMASFMLRHDGGGAEKESKGRLRDALRETFRRLGAKGPSEVGDQFFPDGGFFSYLAPDEIPAMAFEAGYEVAVIEEGPYPHALFLPLSTRTESNERKPEAI